MKGSLDDRCIQRTSALAVPIVPELGRHSQRQLRRLTPDDSGKLAPRAYNAKCSGSRRIGSLRSSLGRTVRRRTGAAIQRGRSG